MQNKSTAELLQELENLRRRLARTEKLAHLGHWCLNLDSGQMHWSEGVFRLFGQKPGQSTPTQAAFIESLHPDDQEPLRQFFDNSLDRPDEFDIDHRLVRTGGSIRYLQQRIEVIKDTSGVPRRLFGAVQDITARKELEKELQRTNTYLEDIIENSPDPIGIVDARGKITKWNKAAEEIYGYNAAEINGKTFTAFYADPGELNLMVAKLRQHGFLRNYEIAMQRKGGEIFPASLSISLLRGEDQQVLGSITTGRDLTDIKANLAALQQVNTQLQTLVQETERCNLETNIINSMSEQLQSCLSCAEAYPIIVQQAQDLFPSAAGALFVLNTSHNLVEAVATWGDAIQGEQVFPPQDCWALRRGRLRGSGDPNLEMPCGHMAAARTENYLCLPLSAQGETLGMLHIQELSLPARERSESVHRLAVTAGDHISLALANIRLRETLRYQVAHDPLTDLFNRRYLEETLVRELHRVRRKNAPLGVIILDLDQFKHFNDTHGYEAGDNLLRTVGQYLLMQVRQEDVACRYGSDEFVLVLPEAPVKVVLARAEEIRQAVPQLQVFHRGEVLDSIAVSLGVAMFPEHGATEETLIHSADNAKRRAKLAGRNCVMLAENK